jgi:hypothetical protein
VTHQQTNPSTHDLLLAHEQLLKSDPNRLSTEFMYELVGKRKYVWRSEEPIKIEFERVTKQKNRSRFTKRTNTGHKGDVSRREWTRLYSLVRAGKASWWSALRSPEDAIESAGL